MIGSYNKDLEIVLAKESDIDEIFDIILEASKWLNSKNIDQWTQEGLLKKVNRDYYSNCIQNGEEVYIAKLDEKTAGTFLIRWSDPSVWPVDDNDAGYIHHLAIRREFAGRGLGFELIKWTAKRISEEGKKYIRLDCRSDNQALNNYYINHGLVFKGTCTYSTKMGNRYESEVDKLQ